MLLCKYVYLFHHVSAFFSSRRPTDALGICSSGHSDFKPTLYTLHFPFPPNVVNWNCHEHEWMTDFHFSFHLHLLMWIKYWMVTVDSQSFRIIELKKILCDAYRLSSFLSEGFKWCASAHVSDKWFSSACAHLFAKPIVPSQKLL